MRILSILFSLLVVLVGLLFGALNPGIVRVDLYFTAFELAMGPALLLAALAGALLGGLAVALGVAVPLRRRLTRREPPPATNAVPATMAPDTAA